MIHINLSIGSYFNREDSLFRFYSSFSLFTRIFYSAGNGVALEPIAPFGVQPAFGIEISPFAKFRFFVEYAPLFYLSSRPDLLLASYTKHVDRNQGFFIPLPFMIIGLVNFQMGVRWIF